MIHAVRGAGILPESDLRIEALSWLLLSLDNVKAAILRGSPVQIEPWQRLVDEMSGLCPKAETLTIKYVFVCHECRKQSETEPSAKPVDAARAEARPGQRQQDQCPQ